MRATVRDNASGRRYVVRSQYLLGADGGRRVASLVGVGYEGLGVVTQTATLHVSADFSPWAPDPDVLIRLIFSPQAGVLVVMVPMGPQRWGPAFEEWVVHLNYPVGDPGPSPTRRSRPTPVLRSMRAQSMVFSELNVEYGYSYQSAAIVPDGSAAPAPADEIRVYQPSTRPGAPLPHAWVDDEDGHRRPIKDLVAPGRFLLIAGEDGQAWCEAARQLAAEANAPLYALRIGTSTVTCTTRAAPGCAIARSPAAARSWSARTGSSPGATRPAPATRGPLWPPRSARSWPGRSARRSHRQPDTAAPTVPGAHRQRSVVPGPFGSRGL